jgi:hypothetical protein
VFAVVVLRYLFAVVVLQHLIVNMKKLSVQIEEQLLWKLLQFCGFGSTGQGDETVTEEENPRK